MAVVERLERPVGDEGAEQSDVGDKGALVGVLVQELTLVTLLAEAVEYLG